ncbi:MAG: hypothetical protein WCQ54_09555 [Clostridiaceae bacterium]
MFDFRLQGIDILPDSIGYILFAVGLSLIAAENNWFKKAGKLNIFMIFLSIFQIYEKPAEGIGINIGSPYEIIIGIAATIISLLLIYNLFMGIGYMASLKGKTDIEEEAHKRWTQYLMLQLAVLLAFLVLFIPIIAFLYFILLIVISIVFGFIVMGFMRRCGNSL